MTTVRSRAWTLAALGLAASLAVGLSWCILKSPLTLYDGLDPILASRRSASTTEIFRASLGSAGYLRPLRLAQIKAVFDLSPLNPTRAYKSIHVGLVFAAFLLFVLWLRPGSMSEFTAAASEKSTAPRSDAEMDKPHVTGAEEASSTK